MSHLSRRKRLVDQILLRDIESLTEKQSIVKVLRSKGNNLHEVESPEGERYLMSMPTIFRNVVYVKIGDYVLVEAIEEGVKVKAEMVNKIFPEQIQDLVKRGIWPERFQVRQQRNVQKDDNDKESDDDDDDDELFRNPNRPVIDDDSESEDSSDNSDNECNDDSANEDNNK